MRFDPQAVGGSGKTMTIDDVQFFTDAAGEKIAQMTTLRAYFGDDFGGNALDLNRWTVLDGGQLGVNVGNPSVAQGAIGTGITGITHSVGASALTIGMGTTANAEKWLLSNTVLCGTEDVLMVVSRSQNIVGNSFQVGLVEVDPVTFQPLLNPFLPGEFNNKAVVEFGQAGNNNWTGLRTIADSSPAETSVVSSSMNIGLQEFLLSVRAEDVHLQNGTVDSATAKTSYTLRISSQVPNDTKLYKLIIRLRNIGTPASATTFTMYRVLVQDHQAQAVTILEGPGDATGSRAMPTTVTNAGPIPVSGTVSTYPLTMANAVESVTPLAASGVFTGAVKTGTSSVFRLIAHGIADQAGTLYLDIISGGVPIGPIASALFTQVQGSTFYAGQLDVQLVPSVQYRLRFVNNATAQTTFILVSRQGA